MTPMLFCEKCMVKKQEYNLSVGNRQLVKPICLDALDFPSGYQSRQDHLRISSKEEKSEWSSKILWLVPRENKDGRNRDSHSWPMCHLWVTCTELQFTIEVYSSLQLKNVTLAGKYLISIFSLEVAKWQNWFLFVFQVLKFNVSCYYLLSIFW